MNVVSISSHFFLFRFVCLFLFCFVLFVCFFPRLEELGYHTGEHKFTYNPLINFRDFIGNLGHVVPNRRAGVRQYTPSVLIFFLRFFRGKKA